MSPTRPTNPVELYSARIVILRDCERGLLQLIYRERYDGGKDNLSEGGAHLDIEERALLDAPDYFVDYAVGELHRNILDWKKKRRMERSERGGILVPLNWLSTTATGEEKI